MEWGTSDTLEELRGISQLYQLWATYSIVSPDAISKSEYALLQASDLPMGDSLYLGYRAYLLGKAEAQARPSLRKSIDIDFTDSSSLTAQDMINITRHEGRLAATVKSMLASEIESIVSSGDSVDLRSIVVKCMEELKVIKNSAYVQSIINKEGVYRKSLGIASSIASTEAIYDIKRVKDLPDRNVYDLVFIPEDMAKAIGDSALSATVKPAGPQNAQKTAAAKPPAVGSMPGVAAPTQTAGPGRPSGTAATQPATGSAEALVSCPYGGGEACIQAGGNGANQHKEGGVIMKRHAEALAAGDKPPSEEGEKELVQQEIRDTIKYDNTAHPHAKVLHDLKNGEIHSKKQIGSDGTPESGATESYLVSLVGGGKAVAKPNFVLPEAALEGDSVYSGGGTVPLGRNVGREVATYNAAVLHGATDLVPPTASRTQDGKLTSIQQWKDNHTNGYAAVGQLEGKVTNATQAFIQNAPAEAKEKIKRKLNQLIVNTIITNDNDKHFDNIVINEDFSDFYAIDGAFSFGNSLSGYKNTIQLDMHNAGMKVKVDQETQTRLSNMSFGDYKKGLQSNVADWVAGQSFLRNRYLLYLQQTEGEIDYEKFRSTVGNTGQSDIMKHPGMWNNLPDDEFLYRKAKGYLPHQLFDGWAKGYLEQAAADETHSDHHDAKQLLELGVFMGPGFAQNPDKYRREGKHIEYAKTIEANMDLPRKIRRDSKKELPFNGDPDKYDPLARTEVAAQEDDLSTVSAQKTKR